MADINSDFNPLSYVVITVMVIDIDSFLDPELELGISMLDLFPELELGAIIIKTLLDPELRTGIVIVMSVIGCLRSTSSVAAANPAPHQTTLARPLHVSTPPMGTTLDRLERHGRVTLHRSSHDAMYRMIRVTALGLSILPAGQEIERSLLARTEGLRAQLLKILSSLMQQRGAA